MTIKHNQQIQHNHFRKDWQRYVRTHFDQPAKKVRRRQARQVKAAKVAPRPVDKLRPVVRCPTIKYNRRVRAGRGFSLQELKAAGIPRKYAATVGISIDPRRSNLSEESLTVNVDRLKKYMERLIVFPRRNGAKAQKKGDASVEEVKAAKGDAAHGGRGENILKKVSQALPIVNDKTIKEGKVDEAKKTGEEDAYRKLRLARSDARLVGVREKRAKLKAEEADSKKK